jgi:hypothetical protein
MIKNPTINDFKIKKDFDIDYIEWKEIENVLGKRRYKQFGKWMMGQTSIKQGAYVCDIENFLRKEKDRFFD